MSDDSWNSSDEELLNDTTYDSVIVTKIIEKKQKTDGLNDRVQSLLQGVLMANQDTDEFISLCESTVSYFLAEPSLLRLEPPILLFGDLHGQFQDLLYFLQTYGCAPSRNLLFLGDYVDRGSYSVEILTLLFSLKQLYPRNVHILRGNHEEKIQNSVGGFLQECLTKYSQKAWDAANKVLHVLPIAAIIGNEIFCVHGGLSPNLTKLSQIEHIERPCAIPSEGLLCDLLWADPNPDKHEGGWMNNHLRLCSYFYGPDVAHEFLDAHNFRFMVRAHQVVDRGYEWYTDRVLTLFSAPNYVGVMDNDAAILEVTGNMGLHLHTYSKRKK